MLRSLLCGCIRSEDDGDIIPDERTHLLHSERESVHPAGIDEQKLHDKLEAIVRLASSKMVNVYSRKPFTLTSARSPPTSPGPTLVASTSSLPPRFLSCSHAHRRSYPLQPQPSPILTMVPSRASIRGSLRWDSRPSSPAPSSGSRSSSLTRGGAGPGSSAYQSSSPLVRFHSDTTRDDESDEDTDTPVSPDGYFAISPGMRVEGHCAGCACEARLPTSMSETKLDPIPIVYSWSESET
ncbi:hypothetical protein MKEN_01337300 [Mycena kentingensis (nom. inval.)]|nr:hypothetical protein MKEN_01337300 [Mycena kentingensis (nom. inval.)]